MTQKLYVSLALQKSSHTFTKIVFKPLRTNLFHIVLSAFFLTIGIQKNYAQDLQTKTLQIKAENESDSLIFNKERFTEINDTIKKDSLPKLEKKSLLEGKIKYTATDYAKIDQKNKLITLYNNAELYYLDIELKA
ncbi:MAG: LPS-assembly protein LptD, partial [Flavobacterium sp.]|nr:LPS-assembly protein LptD [Flavobacterium sp.]